MEKNLVRELIALGKNSYRKINKGDWEPTKVIKNRLCVDNWTGVICDQNIN